MFTYPYFTELVDAYRKPGQICVFTGAGVSFTEDARYRAPQWKDLLHETFKLLLCKKEGPAIKDLWEDLKAQHPDAWDLATAIKNWATDEQDYLRSLREAVLQENKSLDKYKRLKEGNLRKAHTLNAVIAFCSTVRDIKTHPCLDINPKIHAVITTNYDFFLEAGATTKHQANRFKPVARTTSREEEGKLPIYHLHGYFPFYHCVPPMAPLILDRGSYEKAYHPNGRAVQILKKFVGQLPTLFIGFSFDDKFLLDQLKKQRSGHPQHFALLRAGNKRPPEFFEEIEKAGVAPILYQEHMEVEDLLFHVYASALPEGGIPVSLKPKGMKKTTEKIYSRKEYWSMLIHDKKWLPPGG